MDDRNEANDRVGGFPLAPPPSATGLNSSDQYREHLRKVIAFYDSFADEISRAPSFHLGYDAASRWLYRVAQVAAEGPLQRVLDLCCGQGRSAELRTRQYQAKTLAFDINLYQLMLARRGASTSENRLAFCGADAHLLPLQDAVVDLVIIEDALAHCDDRPAVLAEVRRVLRDRGCLVVTDVVERKGLSPTARTEMLQAWAVAPLENLHSYAELAHGAGLDVLRCEHIGAKLLRAQRRWDERRAEIGYERHLEILETRAVDFIAEWGEERYKARLARLRTFVDLESGALDYALVVARKAGSQKPSICRGR